MIKIIFNSFMGSYLSPIKFGTPHDIMWKLSGAALNALVGLREKKSTAWLIVS